MIVPNKSDAEELSNATHLFKELGDAMRRRGVHHASPSQVYAWMIADKEKERTKKARLMKIERKKTLRQERSQLPLHQRVVHFIKHLF